MINICAHFDLRIASLPQTGVSKHVYQMINGLANSEGFKVGLLISRDQMSSEDGLRSWPLDNFHKSYVPVPHRTSRLLWEYVDVPIVDSYCGNYDWIYCPMTFTVPVRNIRQACTFHGFPYFERGIPGYNNLERYILRYRSKLQANKAVKRSDLLLAVSEYAKNELVWLTGISPERVKVVGNGVEQLFFDAGKSPPLPEPKRPFFLSVGGLNVWDGGEHLLGAAYELSQREPDYQVLIAGNQHDGRYLKAAVEIPNIQLLDYVPAERLVTIMQQARALWFLPNVESFGITALEAMAAGTPVVASRFTGVPATVGDAGWMVDATNAREIVDVSITLANDQKLREDFISRGKLRAQTFTWGACVDRLASYFKDAG